MTILQAMKTIHKYCTSYLFSTPSFWSGAGSVMNLGGSYFSFNHSTSDNEADRKAIDSDFFMVGQDCWSAFEEIGELEES